MSERRNFIRKDLGDGYIVCEDVHLPAKAVCTIYLGPGGIYVLAGGRISPEKHYRQIQNLLGNPRTRLYLLCGKKGISGLYDPDANVLCGTFDDDALSDDIEAWLSEKPTVYDEVAIERMIAHIRSADIKARGYAVQDSGNVMLYRHGTLTEASSHSSDLQYYLTLFTGTLGLHRFALGKISSGLIYLFTGGFFLAGWILDLVRLFASIQKDSSKRYLFPMRNRLFKLCIFPLGLLAAAALFKGFISLANSLGNDLFNVTAKQIQNTDPSVFQNIIDELSALFSR